MYQFLTLRNFDLKGKVVGVRVDINSPIIKGKVVSSERIVDHAKTIKELSEKGAKVVVLAHQGRKGKPDCLSLEAHTKLLAQYTKRKINFVPDVFSPQVLSTISSMGDGEIVVLENLRFYDDETQPEKKDNIILQLEPYFDYYVFDAFSVAHRNQTSVLGFTQVPALAGLVMEKELLGINKILETKSPHVYFFGGAKADDLIDLLEVALPKGDVDFVLLSGVIGELALIVRGYELGGKVNFLRDRGFLEPLPRLKKLMDKYADNFILPEDVAVVEGGTRIEIAVNDLVNNKELLDRAMIQDIGARTVSKYKAIMDNAGSVYLKGTAGNFEESKLTQYGTREIMKTAANSPAFTFLGGGHTVTAAEMFKVKDKFSYLSLAGGALVAVLSGKTLPGIQLLENSFNTYEKHVEDFIVVGSHVQDTFVDLPRKLADLELGDKVRIKSNFRKAFGGGGMNTSMCLNHLGVKVAYLGKFSTENMEELKSEAKKKNLKLIETKPTKTPCDKSVILDTAEADRVIFAYRGNSSKLKFSDFNVKDLKTKNYYFSSLLEESLQTQISLAKYIRRTHGKSMTKPLIFYNPGSYVIRNEPEILKLVSLVDVLILNYDEAQEILQEEGLGISDCLVKLFKYVGKAVVITDGAHGAYAYDGEKEYFQKSVSFSKKVYATGAGDCFSSTFSYFYSIGKPLKQCLGYAAINAASLITKPGAQSGFLTYKELTRKAKELNF